MYLRQDGVRRRLKVRRRPTKTPVLFFGNQQPLVPLIWAKWALPEKSAVGACRLNNEYETAYGLHSRKRKAWSGLFRLLRPKKGRARRSEVLIAGLTAARKPRL